MPRRGLLGLMGSERGRWGEGADMHTLQWPGRWEEPCSGSQEMGSGHFCSMTLGKPLALSMPHLPAQAQMKG